jgi:hypothetical protein
MTETPWLPPLNTPTTGRCLTFSTPAVSLSPSPFPSAAIIRLSLVSIMASTTMITCLISEKPVIATKTYALILRHPAALTEVVPPATAPKTYVPRIRLSAAHLGLAYGSRRRQNYKNPRIMSCRFRILNLALSIILTSYSALSIFGQRSTLMFR